jgi:hypothetical protein
LVDRPVPSNLKPSLANALVDRATPYKDRCHTQQNLIASTQPCVYGNLKSKTTIVLFGDSHALAWFPAIELLAKAKSWKLYSLTMSSCWPADIPAWNSTTSILMNNCGIWRANTLKQIVVIKPSIVFLAGTRGFATINADGNILKGIDRTDAWDAGMKRTIDTLKVAGKKVVYLSDIPTAIVDVNSCLVKHPKSILACSNPVPMAISTDWLEEEHQVAAKESITWIDPTLWVCSTNPCSPIVGNILKYVDPGHMTATFAISLEKPLWKQLSAVS